MQRIACLHTAQSNIAVFDAAFAEFALEGRATLSHMVRPDLLSDAEAAGGLTQTIVHETENALRALSVDSDVVIMTCSTLGPAAVGLSQRSGSTPVLRADAALACEAVAHGGEVVVLCAAETTLQSTQTLFEEAAAETGAKIDIRLVPGAWAAFKRGDHRRYLALVAMAANEAQRDGAARVALAQASMTGAAELVTAASRPLTSPKAALTAALRRIGGDR